MERTHIPLFRVKPDKKRKSRKIRPFSLKREKLNREYKKLREEFLKAHPYCQWQLDVWGLKEEDAIAGHGFVGLVRVLPASDVHHKRGRGKYLLDTSTWMAVSRAGHDSIHANPKESYEKGWMLPR